MPRRRRNPEDLYHHTTAEKAARIYREGRLRSAGEPDVYVTTADYDIGYGPVAVPIWVPASVLELDDEFPDGRRDYRIHVKKPGGSVTVAVGKPFPVRKTNPRGRLLELPMREIAVAAYPVKSTSSLPGHKWWLAMWMNGQDTGEVVRDPKDGIPVGFKTKTAAKQWWKKHGQEFTDRVGRAAYVRTRKANSARRSAPSRSVLEPVQSVRDRRRRRNVIKKQRRRRKINPTEGEQARRLARELGISVTKARRELSRRRREKESFEEKVERQRRKEQQAQERAAAARAKITELTSALVEAGWGINHESDSGSLYLKSPTGKVLRISDHYIPPMHSRGAKRLGGADAELVYMTRRGAMTPAQIQRELNEVLALWGERRPNRELRTPNSELRTLVRQLERDPTLSSASMRKHLKNISKRPGSARSRGRAASEWKEFAGYDPNHVEEIVGVAMEGSYPGVRLDRLEGVGAESGREVEIDASHSDLWLIWFNSGERFSIVGGPSAMRELACDFARLNEPVFLTRVDYVAPRYPVPEGERRTKANADPAVAFTHAVENPTLMVWNGETDPRRARFDVVVEGPKKRWVNRSGLIF